MDLLLTDSGREAAARLSAARQDSFAELLGDVGTRPAEGSWSNWSNWSTS
ncbi:hypothetical protein U5640_26495 [Streptomyces sp. SS7]